MQEKTSLTPGDRLQIHEKNDVTESQIYNLSVFFCGISRCQDSIQLSLALEYTRKKGQHIVLPISFSLRHSGQTPITISFDGERDTLQLLVQHYDIQRNTVVILNAPPTDHAT